MSHHRYAHHMTSIRISITIAALAILLTGCSSTTATTAATSPSSVAKTSTAPDAPALSVSRQQALIAAQGYLAMGSGFSYQGLIDQLSSPNGNAFPVVDATAAVDLLKADYNAQAVLAAKGYIAMGGFSHTSLVSQLTSSSGNKFTPEQAEYATTKVGL